MKRRLLISMVALAASVSHAAILIVPGDANIYGAGRVSPPNPGGGGAGSLPPFFSFSAAAGQILTFSSITGAVRIDADQTPGFSNGADGGNLYTLTDITSFDGLSGIIHNQKTMFLVGVFLDGTPSGAAPARLDFSAGAIREDFLSLSPQLQQVFFIGDGFTGTGSGTVQQFHVPPAATRLFLGFADAYDVGTNTISGAPGYYDDNDGSITATFTIVPEPSVSALLAIGLAFCLRRRSPDRKRSA